MKKSRQEEILSIILLNNVETQEELTELLKSAGFAVTQATVSRDIRELNLTKITGENGKQKYVSLTGTGQLEHDGVRSMVKAWAVSVENAGNLLVIKTRTGMGMAVAWEIDDMEIPEILGTIGSDDVVFCAVKTAEQAEKLREFFLSVING